MEEMKKIVVLSDTHHREENLKRITPILLENDLVIHLGDYVSDMNGLKAQLGDKLIQIKGNCDFMSQADDEQIINVEGVRIFLTHGHRYNVKTTLINLGYEALSKGCQLALYGHTHMADITEFEGVKLVNPGSLSVPRNGVPSYCYLLIYGGKVYPKIVELN